MSMRQLLSEHQRISILMALAEAPGMGLNDSILRDVLDAYGLDASRDQVKTELAWLAEQGLVVTETVSTSLVASLTDRGLDVAQGRSIVPGVKRPSPKRG